MIKKKIRDRLTIAAVLLLISIPSFAAADSSCATVRCGDSVETYSSFEKAWNAAVDKGKSSDGVVFTLMKDWRGKDGSLGSGSGFDSGALSYSGGHHLTIDLNGWTIDRNVLKPKSKGAVIYVKSELTIMDSRYGEHTSYDRFKGGAVTGGANDDRGGGIVVSDNSTLHFYGGTILNCVSTDDGGAVSVEGKGAKLDVNGGSFYGNRTFDAAGECCGGAIYSCDSTISIRDAFFEGNYAEDCGGAIYADDGTLNVYGSCFYSNYSREEGGAFYANDDQKSEFESCIFSYNRSDDDGGAVFIDAEGGTYLTDCRMDYNQSASEGGAVHVNDDKVFVIGGQYQYNTASEYGGGIYVDSMDDVNIAGRLVVSDNKVGDRASDLCLQDGVSTTAYLYSGGLYEGSSVWLCSTGSGSRLAISGIDKYQYDHYIHFDKGYQVDKLTEQRISEEGMSAQGTAMGTGNIFLLLGLAGVILFTCLVLFLYTKKKKKGADADAVKTE